MEAKNTYLMILASAAESLKSATKSFRRECAEVARKARRLETEPNLRSAMGAIGFVEGALRQAAEEKARVDLAVEVLKTAHRIGQMSLGLTAAEFLQVTGLDAETYEAPKAAVA